MNWIELKWNSSQSYCTNILCIFYKLFECAIVLCLVLDIFVSNIIVAMRHNLTLRTLALNAQLLSQSSVESLLRYVISQRIVYFIIYRNDEIQRLKSECNIYIQTSPKLSRKFIIVINFGWSPSGHEILFCFNEIWNVNRNCQGMCPTQLALMLWTYLSVSTTTTINTKYICSMARSTFVRCQKCCNIIQRKPTKGRISEHKER